MFLAILSFSHYTKTPLNIWKSPFIKKYFSTLSRIFLHFPGIYNLIIQMFDVKRRLELQTLPEYKLKICAAHLHFKALIKARNCAISVSAYILFHKRISLISAEKKRNVVVLSFAQRKRKPRIYGGETMYTCTRYRKRDKGIW